MHCHRNSKTCVKLKSWLKTILLIVSFAGNIEENILLDRSLDQDRLNQCIESCYLSEVRLRTSYQGLKFEVCEFEAMIFGGLGTQLNWGRTLIMNLEDPVSTSWKKHKLYFEGANNISLAISRPKTAINHMYFILVLILSYQLNCDLLKFLIVSDQTR